MYSLRFIKRTHICSDIWKYSFTADRLVDFIPGQYADFYIGKTFRTMTVTSLPGEHHIEFITRHPSPQSSYKHELEHLQKGDQVSMSDTLGDMILPRNTSVNMLFIMGGIGLASVVPLLKQQLYFEPRVRDCSLLWAHKPGEAALYETEIGQFPFREMVSYVSPQRLVFTDITHRLDDVTRIYLSGTQPFVEHFLAELRNHGITDDRIAFDYFTGY